MRASGSLENLCVSAYGHEACHDNGQADPPPITDRACACHDRIGLRLCAMMAKLQAFGS